MLPDPLHPAVVHLPLALAFLQPLLVVLALIAIQRKFQSNRLWIGIVILQGLLFGGVMLAKETGEDQEHRVEAVVAKAHVHAHEDAADRLALAAFIALAAAGFGLFTRRLGWTGKGLTLVLSIVVLVFAMLSGKSGGELVYKHGAARVYWQEK